jgi:hypothetical protein
MFIILPIFDNIIYLNVHKKMLFTVSVLRSFDKVFVIAVKKSAKIMKKERLICETRRIHCTGKC